MHPKANAIALSKASPMLFTFSEPIKLVDRLLLWN